MKNPLSMFVLAVAATALALAPTALHADEQELQNAFEQAQKTAAEAKAAAKKAEEAGQALLQAQAMADKEDTKAGVISLSFQNPRKQLDFKTLALKAGQTLRLRWNNQKEGIWPVNADPKESVTVNYKEGEGIGKDYGIFTISIATDAKPGRAVVTGSDAGTWHPAFHLFINIVEANGVDLGNLERAPAKALKGKTFQLKAGQQLRFGTWESHIVGIKSLEAQPAGAVDVSRESLLASDIPGGGAYMANVVSVSNDAKPGSKVSVTMKGGILYKPHDLMPEWTCSFQIEVVN